MEQMKALAPTVIDALNAVELGCRKAVNDTYFSPYMHAWMRIFAGTCLGCLATATLMHLTQKTGKDIVKRYASAFVIGSLPVPERVSTYGLEEDYNDFVLFENAVDSLRRGDLLPLLELYGLSKHRSANEAIAWLHGHHTYFEDFTTTKEEMSIYADFVKDVLMPKMRGWFVWQ
jgi:hypothetical protein